MILVELSHVFSRYENTFAICPKELGFYRNYADALATMEKLKLQPGFRENPDAFVFREWDVIGEVRNDRIYQASLYYHTEDLELEGEIKLGLYAMEEEALQAVRRCMDLNPQLLGAKDVICEENVCPWVIGKLNGWEEGYETYPYSAFRLREHYDGEGFVTNEL